MSQQVNTSPHWPLYKDEKLWREVFYVTFTNDQPISPIAIRPRTIAGRIEWEDTARGHWVPIKSLEELSDGSITVRSMEGGTYTLIPLSLALFQEHVVDRVAAFDDDFKDDNALRQYYLNTNFELYP